MSKVILAAMVVVVAVVPILALHQPAQAAYGCPVGQVPVTAGQGVVCIPASIIKTKCPAGQVWGMIDPNRLIYGCRRK